MMLQELIYLQFTARVRPLDCTLIVIFHLKINKI